MNILITGGYGFIGSYLMERFYKEGHNVYIIDNFSRVSQTSSKIKHKLYKLDVKDPRCSEIFDAAQVDRVIHLAEGPKDNPIDNLKAVLDLSIKHKVPKFIYLSSTDLYGIPGVESKVESDKVCPTSLQKIHLAAAEAYLELCNTNEEIQVHCLRVSEVYGPSNRRFKTLIHSLESERLVDCIYIGDVVDAIYKATQFCQSHLLNICSYTLCNKHYIEDLIEKDSKKNKEQADQIFLTETGYSNKKATYELNWVPKYNLVEGLSKSLWTTYEEVETAGKQAPVVPTKKKGLRKVIPYIENIFSFIVIVLLTDLFNTYHMEPIIDLSLIYIAIMAILYGFNQSCIAIILSSFLYLGDMIGKGQSLVALIYNPNTLLNISLYIFVGVVLAYIVDSKKHQIEEKDRACLENQEKFEFIYTLYQEVLAEKKSLEYQIATNEDSFGKIYKVISRLDSLSPDKIFDRAIDTIEQLLKVDCVAIYMGSSNSQYLRIIAHSIKLKNELPPSLQIKDLFQEERENIKSHIYVNKQLEKDRPTLLSPIIIDKELIAVICIYNLEFNKLTLYTQNLFSIISNLITSTLVKAHQHEYAILSEKYIPSTTILQPKYFRELVKSKEESMISGISQYILLKVDNALDKEVYESVISSIREVDVLGINETNELFILLSNTTEEGAHFVSQRLDKKQISAHRVESIEREEAC